MFKVYISGPITAKTKEREQLNVNSAMAYAGKLCHAGIAIYFPHGSWYIDEALRKQGKEPLGYRYLQQDLEWIHFCDAIFRIPGDSAGGDIEVQEAERAGIPVYYDTESVIQAARDFEAAGDQIEDWEIEDFESRNPDILSIKEARRRNDAAWSARNDIIRHAKILEFHRSWWKEHILNHFADSMVYVNYSFIDPVKEKKAKEKEGKFDLNCNVNKPTSAIERIAKIEGKATGLTDEALPECIRRFPTGATRDTDTDKLDFEGFLSPFVLQRYAEYMNKHRTQSDGKLRDSDNWQQGIPLDQYMKSAWRHFMNVWTIHRDDELHTVPAAYDQIQESLCALIFNTMGYLHELLKTEES